MRPKILVIVAGVPGAIVREVTSELNRKMEHVDVVTCHPLNQGEGYSEEYAEVVYQKFARSIKRRDQAEGSEVLRESNVVLLYLDKTDDTDRKLIEKFGTEALILPIAGMDVTGARFEIKNKRDRFISDLVERGKRTVERAHKLLSVITEEVTNKDNRTCLLLPPKNFGARINLVYRCVREAVINEIEGEEFKNRIRAVARNLPKKKVGHKQCFVGAKGLIFEGIKKGGPRHGQVPEWGAGEHDYSCLIRGKMRFGIPYDPKFHYDCDLSKGVVRRFPSCHGEVALDRSRQHVNIAPNDNIR